MDGQEYFIDILTEGEHQLVITKDGSTISKEIFFPTIGINSKHIYTKSLPAGELILIIQINGDEIKKTTIIIE